MDNETRERLDAELAVLNAHVNEAVGARTAWMDAHMDDYADFHVGDVLYDRNGDRLGPVTRLYRYWGGLHGPRDPQYDTLMSVDYEYLDREFGNGCRVVKNTSSQPGLNLR